MRPIQQITQTLRTELDNLLPRMTDEKITLLYIDDEAPNLRAFKATFRRSNFNILTANNLDEAFDVLSTNKVHILFTDYRLPVHTGEQILKAVLAVYPNLVPVVLSGYLTEEVRSTLTRRFKGITLIEKPFNYIEVAEIIKNCFATWESKVIA